LKQTRNSTEDKFFGGFRVKLDELAPLGKWNNTSIGHVSKVLIGSKYFVKNKEGVYMG